MDRTSQLIGALNLSPHPEGGHYRRVYTSERSAGLGNAERRASSAIFYLLAKEEHSAWHSVDADETWHWYEGAPLELLSLDVDAGLVKREILASGIEPYPGRRRHLVPARTWQAARSLGEYTLVGCTVAPAFEFSGFELLRDQTNLIPALLGRFPEFAVLL